MLYVILFANFLSFAMSSIVSDYIFLCCLLHPFSSVLVCLVFFFLYNCIPSTYLAYRYHSSYIYHPSPALCVFTIFAMLGSLKESYTSLFILLLHALFSNFPPNFCLDTSISHISIIFTSFFVIVHTSLPKSLSYYSFLYTYFQLQSSFLSFYL